jgi:hypothetical protein
MPVMLPREFDADMRRDGSMTSQPVQNQPSMSAEECTACQDPVTGNGLASARDGSNLSSQRRVKYRKTANRRRRWPLRKARNQNARLGVQDKASCLAAGTSFLSVCLHIVFWRPSAEGVGWPGVGEVDFHNVFNGILGGARNVRLAPFRRFYAMASIYTPQPYAVIFGLVPAV